MAEHLDIEYQRMRVAVLELAIRDYKNALKVVMRHSHNKFCTAYLQAHRMAKDCERFFEGENMHLYSDLDGKALMLKIQDLANEEIQNERKAWKI